MVSAAEGARDVAEVRRAKWDSYCTFNEVGAGLVAVNAHSVSYVSEEKDRRRAIHFGGGDKYITVEGTLDVVISALQKTAR